MSYLKLALCSSLLLTSFLATAQTNLEPLDADKRVITMTPVNSKGYTLYNLGLSIILKKTDISALPLPPEQMAGLQEFLNSYQVANVVMPNKPSYNGQVKFDIVSTESGKGVGSYVFEQTYKNPTVTLRVISTPLPSIPFSPEITEAMSYLTEIVETESVQ
jgi:hypothetical protein